MGRLPAANVSAAQERAARLREALRRRGVRKLYGLAIDLGVDQSALSRWKHGGAMSLEHAAELCRHLSISMDWLVLGIGDMELGKDNAEAPQVWRQLRAMPPRLQDSVLTIIVALTEDRK
jgi:hypothetical protein